MKRCELSRLAVAALLFAGCTSRTSLVETHEEPIRFARQELSEWIGKLAEQGPDVRIHVGTEYLSLFPEDRDWLGDTDGFACRRRNGEVYIFSPHPRGCLYGVYAFLERNSDIIWARPTEPFGTVYSRTRKFEIRDADFRERPAFSLRGWGCMDADCTNSVWIARMRCNRGAPRQHFPWASDISLRCGFWTSGSPGHNIPKFFPDEVLGEHPEYLRWYDGRRIKDVEKYRQFCFSNLDGADSAGREAVRQIRKAREDGVPFTDWSVCQSDTQSFCGCEKCSGNLKLPDGRVSFAEAENHKSTLFFNWLNRMMEPIALAFPNLRVSTFAYQYSAPPPDVKVHPNVDVAYCPFIKNDRFPVFSDVNSKWRKRTEEWSRVSSNVVVREYWGCAAGFPRPNSLVAAKDLQWYLKKGITKVYSEGYSDFTSPDRKLPPTAHRNETCGWWDASAIEHWVLSRLMWDPSVPVERLRDEYCERTYRKAAKPMKRLYALIAEKWFADDAVTYWRDDKSADAARYLVRTGADDEVLKLLREASDLARDEVPMTREILKRQTAYFKKLITAGRNIEKRLVAPCKTRDFFVAGSGAKENNNRGKRRMSAEITARGRKLSIAMDCWCGSSKRLTKDDFAELAVVDGSGKVRRFRKDAKGAAEGSEKGQSFSVTFEVDLDELGITGNAVKAALGCRLASANIGDYARWRTWRGVAFDDVTHFGEISLGSSCADGKAGKR